MFLYAASRRYTGYFTAKSVADIYYITHRLTHSDKETRNILVKLFSLFQVADTTGSDCCHAIPSPVSDYEDAIMVQTAARIGADCIVTRNVDDYKFSDVPVYLPEDFVKLLEKE